MWLQQADRRQLLLKLDDSNYRVYKLHRTFQNNYIYDKERYHESYFTDLSNYYRVSVRDPNYKCETYGFDDILVSP